MNAPLRLVSPTLPTGVWHIADDGSVIELVVDGAVRGTICPWTDNASGELAWWGATVDGRQVGLEDRLADACRVAAAAAGVVAPVPADLLARLREPAPEAAAIEGAPADLLKRFADCLAAILDEPLHTLPGAGPDGGREPLQLRLAHFRPDLSEVAAALLDEAGR